MSWRSTSTTSPKQHNSLMNTTLLTQPIKILTQWYLGATTTKYQRDPRLSKRAEWDIDQQRLMQSFPLLKITMTCLISKPLILSQTYTTNGNHRQKRLQGSPKDFNWGNKFLPLTARPESALKSNVQVELPYMIQRHLNMTTIINSRVHTTR
jgi:hypothetical protein